MPLKKHFRTRSPRVETLEPLVLMSASASEIDGDQEIMEVDSAFNDAADGDAATSAMFAADDSDAVELNLLADPGSTLFGSVNQADFGLVGWQLKYELQPTSVAVNLYTDGSFDLTASGAEESFDVKVSDEYGESTTVTVYLNAATDSGSDASTAGNDGPSDSETTETDSAENTADSESTADAETSTDADTTDSNTDETPATDVTGDVSSTPETPSAAGDSVLNVSAEAGATVFGSVNEADINLAGWQLKYELQPTSVAVNLYVDGSFDLNASGDEESFDVEVSDEYGQSTIVTVHLNAGTDSGSTDAGDSGSTDSGSTDSGSTDSGSTDNGSTDSGSTDSGSTDSGSTDSGSTDSGSTDSGPAGDGPVLDLTAATGSTLYGSVNQADLGLYGWQLQYELQPTSVGVNFYPDGSFDLNASGAEEFFQVKVTDEHGQSVVVTVTVNGGTVGGVTENSDPVAVKDKFYGDFGSGVWGNVLDNDSDADQDTLTATLKTQPEHGQIVFNTDGTFDYTPNPGFSGDDVFEYTVTDGNGGMAMGEACIHISSDTSPGPASLGDRVFLDTNGTVFKTTANPVCLVSPFS